MAEKQVQGWKCGECKSTNAEASKFCGECGKKRQHMSSRWECGECKTINEEASKFCGECGSKRQLRSSRWECGECKTINGEATKFCGECGVKRQSMPSSWKCGNCKSVNKGIAKFCVECGNTRQVMFSDTRNASKSQHSDDSTEAGYAPYERNASTGLNDFASEKTTEEINRMTNSMQIGEIPRKGESFEDCLHNERRIVLIGKTGSGKSATGNTILGTESTFISKISAKSVTKFCKTAVAMRFGKKIKLVDTPGLFDKVLSNEKTFEEVGKCVGILAPGPHSIIMVLPINRFTAEEQNTAKELANRFGEGMYNYLIILFTRKDDLTNMKVSIDDYIKETKALANLIKKCQNRYIAFDNFAPLESKERDVESLFLLIEKTLHANGGRCYTNEMFKAAENALKEKNEEDKGRKRNV